MISEKTSNPTLNWSNIQDILHILLNSGINITPSALEHLGSLNASIREIELFIEKISFQLENSLLTKSQIQKHFSSEEQNKNKIQNEIIPPKLDQESDNNSKTHDTSINATPIHNIKNNSEVSNKKVKEPSTEKPIDSSTTHANEFLENYRKNKLKERENDSSNQESEIDQRKLDEKEKYWESLELKSGTSTFTPLALEYNSEYEVLKDPTGHLYVNGDISDFFAVQIDKFESLKEILRKRLEGTRFLDISQINRLSNSVEVDFVGMVISKRRTSSGNIIMEMEDPTGTLMVLINEKNKEIYSLMNHVLEDHVIFLSGYLNITKERNSRIVMVNKIVFPGTKNTHEIHPIQEGLSICLISDTHFGSVDWLEKVWERFVDYLNCRIGNDKQREEAGKIKYVVVAGDIVDGIGVYPNQEKRLTIQDIFKQYEFAAERFSELPDYITLVLSPGDHDAVHKAVPTYAIPKDIAQPLYDIGAKMVGAPAMVSLHGIKTEVFHGTPLIELKKSIPGTDFGHAQELMSELLRARHLGPTYGNETELAPTEKDWLVLKEVPDILHMGHLHKVGVGSYHGIITANTGCFQDQTDYMKRFGIVPDYGKPTIVNITKDRLIPRVLDLTQGL